MKSHRVALSVLLLSFLTLPSIASFAGAAPSRGTSNNGVDVNAPFWNLFGPTAAVSRDDGRVLLRRQVVCTNQQVASAVDAQAALSSSTPPFADAGSCADGAYTFLFQIQSTAKNLSVTISRLVGFTPLVNDPASSYGVETCDSAQNTLELCSNVAAATATALAQLAKINVTVNAKNTAIEFCIPKVPVFPTGSTSQGQGLTLVVLTQQALGLPFAYPDISIK
jgi:hypothetical protein